MNRNVVGNSLYTPDGNPNTPTNSLEGGEGMIGEGKSEFVFNPDYLNFHKGVEAGKIVGELAGRREVVEWIEENGSEISDYDPDTGDWIGSYQSIEIEKWEAQKKEWGVEVR